MREAEVGGNGGKKGGEQICCRSRWFTESCADRSKWVLAHQHVQIDDR